MFAIKHALNRAYGELAEELDRCYENRSEMLAEAGMGAVSLGYSGYDGMALCDTSHHDRFAREAEARLTELANQMRQLFSPLVADVTPARDEVPF